MVSVWHNKLLILDISFIWKNVYSILRITYVRGACLKHRHYDFIHAHMENVKSRVVVVEKRKGIISAPLVK